MQVAFIRNNISLKSLNLQFSMTCYRVSFHVVVVFGPSMANNKEIAQS